MCTRMRVANAVHTAGADARSGPAARSSTARSTSTACASRASGTTPRPCAPRAEHGDAFVWLGLKEPDGRASWRDIARDVRAARARGRGRGEARAAPQGRAVRRHDVLTLRTARYMRARGADRDQRDRRDRRHDDVHRRALRHHGPPRRRRAGSRRCAAEPGQRPRTAGAGPVGGGLRRLDQVVDVLPRGRDRDRGRHRRRRGQRVRPAERSAAAASSGSTSSSGS